MNTAEAIARSISHTEITHVSTAQYSDGMIGELEAECEDWVKGNDEIEYWGTDDDGNEWRVHVSLECGDDSEGNSAH